MTKNFTLPNKLMNGGWFMPAEWGEHEATWMIWPHDMTLWNQFGMPLVALQKEVANVALAIAEFEPVRLLLPAHAVSSARARLGDKVEYVLGNTNDIWARDNGATFITHPTEGLAGVDWIFNSWGNKHSYKINYEKDIAKAMIASQKVEAFSIPFVNEGGAIHVDGEGTLITTESVLLNANRNPDFTKKEIEEIFRVALGVEKVIWLPGDLADTTHDITNGHVDLYAAFARPAVLTLDATRETESDHAKILREHRRILEKETDARGRKFELVPLYSGESENEWACTSYNNYYIANGGIIMPVYGVEADQLAIQTLQKVFPSCQIRPINIANISQGGGGIHCITQQQPKVIRS